jgi:hypothetical protein
MAVQTQIEVRCEIVQFLVGDGHPDFRISDAGVGALGKLPKVFIERKELSFPFGQIAQMRSPCVLWLKELRDMSRFLVLSFTVVVATMYGQHGIFGPVSAHLRAGDFAPDIVFTEILSAAGASPWSSANLSGRVTVLAFFPDTSHNPQAVSRWNALVEQFADKPVQFAWITSQYQPPLGPWLRAHPLKGWVFLDPLGATGLAYGMEEPAAVIIGSDRRIVGFDPAMLPSARTIDAALAGRIATDPPLLAEPPRMTRPEDDRPDFPPSYTLHVSPAKGGGGGEFGGGD